MQRGLLLRLGLLPAAALVVCGTASAALPEAVGTAIATYQADALSAIGLVIGAGVVVWGALKLARIFVYSQTRFGP